MLQRRIAVEAAGIEPLDADEQVALLAEKTRRSPRSAPRRVHRILRCSRAVRVGSGPVRGPVSLPTHVLAFDDGTEEAVRTR